MNEDEALLPNDGHENLQTLRLNKDERTMDFTTAVRLYPSAIGWSIFFSLGVIMIAFDPQLLGNLYATPAFQRDFGYKYRDRYIIPASWQTALGMGSPIGQVFGALFAGYPMEWYGRKRTFMFCIALTTSCIFIQFFARSLHVLVVGELLSGIILGTYAVIAPSYASEVCPIALRGVLTSYVNLCFVIGQLLANIVVTWTSRFASHWAYSLPFALQWIWPAVILTGISFAPESPWWLVRKGKLKEAEGSLKRLASPEVDVKPTLAMIIETDRLEQSANSGTSYVDCFKSTNQRRTMIAVGAYTIQVLTGIYLAGYATYFFELAGIPSRQAFGMGIAFLGFGLIATCLSWLLIVYFGRRRIYITGLAVLTALQLLIGLLDCFLDLNLNLAIIWAQSWLLVIWNFIYDLSIGPVCFIIICECSSTRLRSKTIAIATAVQGFTGVLMTIAIPLLINPDELNMRGKLGFVFGSLAAFAWVWSFYNIPETKGRSYEELDIMFENQVPTREFAQYQVQKVSLSRE